MVSYICSRTPVIAAGIVIIFMLTGGAGAVPAEEWNKTFGGTGEDYAYFVQQTSDGGYILAGTVNGTIINNDTRQPISGVSIVLFDLTALQGYYAETDTTGAYTIEVPAGVYDINIAPPEASGFIGRNELNVEIRQSITKNYALSSGITISGSVTRRDTNQPLANVMVGVLNPDTQQDYGSLTDVSGRYSFSVPGGRYEFHASSMTDANLTTYVEANFTVTSNVNKDVVLGIGVTIRGRVTRSDTNSPVANAFVFYFDKVTRQGNGFPTDNNGNYNIALLPGTYALNVQPPVGSGLTRPIDLIVNVSGNMVRNITLAPGITLSGRITRGDNGGPVVGANVGIVNVDGEGFGTYTDTNGRYSLGVLPGSYIFHTDLPERELVPYDEFSFVITEPRIKDVVLGLGVIVSGTVTRRDTGTPLEGALIHMMNTTSTQGEGSVTTHTDSSGRYSIAVPPGEYRFTVDPPQASDLDLEQGLNILNISGNTVNNVILDAGIRVSGRVTREDTGAPVAFALVAVFDPVTRKGGGGALTDTNGEYRFSVKADTYGFIIEPPRNSGLVSILQQTPQDISSHVVKNVSLSGGVTISGTIKRNDTNQAVAGADVVLVNQSSGLVFRAQTDGNGFYTMGASPGSYQFVVAPPEGSGLAMYIEMEGRRPGQFIVAANAVKDASLSPGVTVDGTVIRSDTGEPVPGAFIGVFNQGTGRGGGGETSENGRYSFSVTAGIYQIHIEPPQGSMLMSYDEFSAVIENNTLKNITLSRGVTLSGRVTRGDTNQPVAGAMIVMFNPVTMKGARPAQTDANGEYSIVVESGTYNLVVPPGEGLSFYTEPGVAVNQDMTKNIVLQPGSSGFLPNMTTPGGILPGTTPPGGILPGMTPPPGFPLIQKVNKESFIQSPDVQQAGEPSITISSPISGQTFSSANITVSGTASSTAGVSKVEVRAGNGSSILASGTASWSAGVTLSPGQNLITAVVTDINNNTGTATVTVTYSVFATPSITISSPLNGQILTGANITVIGTANSNAGVSKVEVKVGNGSYVIATGTVSWSAGAALSPGPNTITAKVTDLNNNINTASITVTFSVFATPSITISSPFNGQRFTNSSITVRGTASSGTATVSMVEVKVGNGSYALSAGTALWSAAVTLGPGTNTITARVTDTNGNTNTASVSVLYSTTATPTPTATATPTPTPSPTPTPGGDVVSLYAGSDGIVQRSEAIQAVIDYFNGTISKQDAIKVVMAYFGG